MQFNRIFLNEKWYFLIFTERFFFFKILFHTGNQKEAAVVHWCTKGMNGKDKGKEEKEDKMLQKNCTLDYQRLLA